MHLLRVKSFSITLKIPKILNQRQCKYKTLGKAFVNEHAHHMSTFVDKIISGTFINAFLFRIKIHANFSCHYARILIHLLTYKVFSILVPWELLVPLYTAKVSLVSQASLYTTSFKSIGLFFPLLFSSKVHNLKGLELSV